MFFPSQPHPPRTPQKKKKITLCQRALPPLPWWSIFDRAIFRGFRFRRLGPLDYKLPTLGGILFFLFHSSTTTLLFELEGRRFSPPSTVVVVIIIRWLPLSPYEPLHMKHVVEPTYMSASPSKVSVAYPPTESITHIIVSDAIILGPFVCVWVCSIERRLDFFVKALAQEGSCHLGVLVWVCSKQQLQGSCARVRGIQNARRRNHLRMVRGGATIFRRSGWLVCVWS